MRLSKPQMLVYTMEKHTGEAVSVLCGSYLLGRDVDRYLLADALNEIVKCNLTLRTTILEKDEVEQYYHEYTPIQYVTKTFSDIEEMDRFASEYAKTPIDIHNRLFEFIILSLPDDCGVLIKMHHIIGDAWTFSLLAKQLNLLLEGNKPICGDYSHFLIDEEAYIKSKRYGRDKAFFIDGFKCIDEIKYLSDSTSKNKIANRKEQIICPSEANLIQKYCQEHSVSPFTLFTEAISIYFSRVRNNVEKFYLGVAILNRSTEEDLNTVGMFVNTVPMFVNLDYAADFETNLNMTRECLLLTMRHQKFNYGDMLKAIREETNFRGQLYDVVLSYQNAKVNESDNRVRTRWYHSGIQEDSLQIHIDDRDNEGIFRVNYDFLTDRFTERQIERMHCHIINILREGMNHGKSKIDQIKMLADDELQTLMYQFRGIAADYPRNKCIHQLFEAHAQKHPDKPAVIACDCTLSYDLLNRLANRVAHSLRNLGVKRGDLIGIKLPRRSHFFAAVLGVLKSGAAYIPIVPDYPRARVDYLMQDSQASLLIDETNIESLLLENCENNPQITVSSEDKCYCRYTSGSTGNPKGVIVCHRNVVNLVVEMDRLEDVDVVMGITNVGFDMCVAENLYAITTGKTLVFADEGSVLDSEKLADLIMMHKADMLTTTPSRMQLYVSHIRFRKALRRLRVISFGGEKMTKEFTESVRALSGAVLSNEYGPTETTCYSTACIIRGTVGEVTIGKPIANTQVYIVDKYMNLTPIGVRGELCIAGDGVGLGYLNRPELTEERFIKNPFGEGKLYKTGDIAYWKEDGNIVYIGRNDSQVKIRGLRIELGEIESAMMAIDGIEQAIVDVHEDNDNHQLICAYYTGRESNGQFIRNKIGTVLPKYMMPQIITHLNALPTTANGKINKKALHEMDLFPMKSDYVAPKNDLEIQLCGLISNITKIEKIGITTDFFELGMDSLKAIEFVLKAKAINIDIPLQKVYEFPTVAEIIKYLNGASTKPISYSFEEFRKYDDHLKKNIYSSDAAIHIRDLGTVVLTGATGFLGSHILDHLIKEGANRVICIVRSEERLANSLSYYFDDKYKCDIDLKIKPVIADISIANLSTCIHERVDTVIHAAAMVKHYGNYEDFERVNVEGTKHALELAKTHHARFIHISTTSVSGNAFSDRLNPELDNSQFDFDEKCLYVGQSLENVYVRSKFEAERIVLAASLDGLDAKIIRVGNLTNRYIDLRFQPNYPENAFLKRIHALIELGLFPNALLNHSIEFSPVDLTACGVVKLAEFASCEQSIFHLYSNKILGFEKLIGLFHQNGIAIEVVDAQVFIQALTKILHTFGKEWIYEAFQDIIDSDGKIRYDGPIHVKNDFTTQFLNRIGFEWGEIDSRYISGYIQYFRNLGYFA